MKTIFFAPYSPENMCLGEILHGRGALTVFLRNKLLSDSKDDYFSLFGSPEFSSSAILLQSEWGDPACLEELVGVLENMKFEPDFVLARGETNQLWPIKALGDSGLLNVPSAVILDRLSGEITDYDIEILNFFDKIYTMGPSSEVERFSEKSISIFKKMESYPFTVETPSMNLERLRVDSPLVLCSDFNFNVFEKLGDIEKSVINVDRCPANELIPYIYLSRVIVNLTGESEVDLILNKMNRKSISLRDFQKIMSDGGKDFAGIYNEFSRENIKEFCEYLEKSIFRNFAVTEGKPIEAAEVRI